MGRGLCVCLFIIQNCNRYYLGESLLVKHGLLDFVQGDSQPLSNNQYTKSSGNWTAARRRKLIRCPCGAFFCKTAARAEDLYSESEWARKGYPFFKSRERYYLDLETAVKKIHTWGTAAKWEFHSVYAPAQRPATCREDLEGVL